MPDTTTTETTTLEMLHQLATDYCAQEDARDAARRDALERQRIEEERQQRRTIEKNAHDHIQMRFPGTLGRVMEPGMWQGYPGGREYERITQHPTAVASLGQGVWLHYERTLDDELLLLHPCRCGGYAIVLLSHELQLCRLLDDGMRTYCGPTCS